MSTSRLILIVGFSTLIRLFINTARRFAYPFAPALSRGMGVSLTAVTSMIAVNQITGLFGLVFAPLGDKWGYRLMMMAGVGALAVGMFCGGLFPYYGMVLLALFMAGLGKTVFDPALQAFVGSRIPYERRGMAIGICETAWAGASLLGIPLVGILIARFGWQSPFFFLGAIGVIGVCGLYLLIPVNEQKSISTEKTSIYITAIRQLIRQRSHLGVMGFAFLLNAGNDNLFVVYGAWLEKNFNLGIVALGIATTVIGAAELLGEMITAFQGDRIASGLVGAPRDSARCSGGSVPGRNLRVPLCQPSRGEYLSPADRTAACLGRDFWPAPKGLSKNNVAGQPPHRDRSGCGYLTRALSKRSHDICRNVLRAVPRGRGALLLHPLCAYHYRGRASTAGQAGQIR